MQARTHAHTHKRSHNRTDPRCRRGYFAFFVLVTECVGEDTDLVTVGEWCVGDGFDLVTDGEL